MSVSKTLAEFDAELLEVGIRGAWTYDEPSEAVVGGPKPAGVPAIWRWDDMYPRMREACEIFPDLRTARRGLVCLNPDLPGGTTHTLMMAMTMLRPREASCWAHRHNFAAIRFALEGATGAATVVDGEVCPMEDYDLVLTPRWSWHDHQNSSDEYVSWFDTLDLGLINRLNVNFYEAYGEESQPQRQDKASYLSERGRLVRPVWEQRRDRHVPMHYPWREVEPVLMEMAGFEGSPYDGVVLEYVNPMTGGPTLPTISCWLQLLHPGEETKAHRHTSSSVHCVVRGNGRVIVDETELSWSRHDAFEIPNWSWHRFVNDSKEDDAVIFTVNDIPTLRALDLYYEEPELSLGQSPWPAVPGDVARQAENGAGGEGLRG